MNPLPKPPPERPSPLADTEPLRALWERTLGPQSIEPLLCAPLMTMSSEFFPDRWTEDLAAARRIVVRAMAYLGHGVSDAKMVGVDEESEELPPRVGSNQALPAWFLGWEQDLPVIGVRLSELTKPALLITALVRASLHAYLVKEERLSQKDHASASLDLMGTFLGWGIVLTHASHVIVRASSGAKYVQLTQLPPAAMATSLAWVAVARRLDPKSVRTIAKALAPNQRDAFERAYRATRSGELPLPGVLRELPEPSQWPPMWDLAGRLKDARRVVKQLPEMDTQSREKGPERGIVGKNKGKSVFMVRRRLSMRIMKFGVGCVFALSMLLRSDPSVEINTGQLMLGGGAFVLLGGLVGRFLYEQRCSDAKCDARLKEGMTECPRCGGTIRGVISNAKERLAAEEALEDPA